MYMRAGGWRLFNVYLPRGYDAHKPYPTWVHLHGVYWGTMDNISERMGFPVLATEATAVWDSLATGPYRDAAVIVYPQALAPGGDTNKRTVRFGGGGLARAVPARRGAARRAIVSVCAHAWWISAAAHLSNTFKAALA